MDNDIVLSNPNAEADKRRIEAVEFLKNQLIANGFTIMDKERQVLFDDVAADTIKRSNRMCLAKDDIVYNCVVTTNVMQKEFDGYSIGNGNKTFQNQNWLVFFVRYFNDIKIRVCEYNDFIRSDEKTDENEGKLTWNFREKHNIYACNAEVERDKYDWVWLEDWMREPFGDSTSPFSGEKRVKMKTDNVITVENIIKNAIEGETKQIVFTGAPGTGKTYSVRKYVEEKISLSGGGYEFVQFHSSYDYSDFVEGLRPVMADDKMVFVRMDGTFKSFCRKAAADREHDYYFIIDEINRADLSKVFGELMFSFEESYRGEKNRVRTQYSNLDTYVMYRGKAQILYDDCFKTGFYIPENVYIIGTMNDIDRSVEAFDFALRRRFKWIDVKANEIMESSLKSMLGDKAGEICKNVINMNKAMSDFKAFALNEAYHIGPAYFKKYGKDENLEKIWINRVEPILKEYSRGRRKDDVDEFISNCHEALFEKISSEEE